MMYTELEINNRVYKLRLNTRSVVVLEKQLGGNPLSIFGNGETLPSITTMVTILHTSLQAYHHGITLNDTYDLFDKYLEEHVMTDFLPVIIEIYKVSGLIAKDNSEEKNFQA